MTNPMGKGRPTNKPYLVVTNGGWTWKVLKAYSADPNKPGARWFVDASSPYTFGGSDLGDTYVKDVAGTVTYRDPAVPDSALPSWLS